MKSFILKIWSQILTARFKLFSSCVTIMSPWPLHHDFPHENVFSIPISICLPCIILKVILFWAKVKGSFILYSKSSGTAEEATAVQDTKQLPRRQTVQAQDMQHSQQTLTSDPLYDLLFCFSLHRSSSNLEAWTRQITGTQLIDLYGDTNASINWVIIGPGNGLVTLRHQAITWTNGDSLSIRPLGTNFREIWMGMQIFSLKKIYLKMSAKWQPFYSVLAQCVKGQSRHRIW